MVVATRLQISWGFKGILIVTIIFSKLKKGFYFLPVVDKFDIFYHLPRLNYAYIYCVVDKSIPKMFQSTNDDYYKSGYDRGHLAAAANHRWVIE